MLVLVFGFTVLAGCTVDELSLLYALCKQPEINSKESKTELTFSLSSKGLTGEFKKNFSTFANVLNGTKLNIDQKLNSNDQRTVTKSQTDMSLDLGGVAFSASAWSDVDLSGETPLVKQIIKVPSLLTLALPGEAAGKQYMVLDTKELLPSDSSDAFKNFSKKYIDYNKNLNVSIINFIKEYAKSFDPGFPIVTRKENKVVNNEVLSVYNLKIDDASFKKLLDYTVKDAVQNEATIELVREIAFSAINISELSYRERLNQRIAINKSIEEFKTGLPEYLKIWDQIMDILKDVKILGDKGIDIEYGINSEGYIVSEKGSIDFEINLKEVETAIERFNAPTSDDYIDQELEEMGIIYIRIDFDTVHSNINKNVVIEPPVLTPDNSFNLKDILYDSLSLLLTGRSNTTNNTQIEADKTPPAMPKVDKVIKTSTSVTGTADPYSIITIKKGNTVLGTDIASEQGSFNVVISPVKEKCTLTVTATDFSGNESLPVQIQVN